MTAFSTSFGRLHSIRRRDPTKNPVQPIDVDAAQQYDNHNAAPGSSSLLTPRPHHYRSTTPSPATPAASSFPSSSSTRLVSSPTLVSSSSALAAVAHHDDAFQIHLDALTPPLSPVQPNTAAALHATKSPLRRALSRTFFFASTHHHAQPTPPRISAPINLVADAKLPRAPRPPRPARPATSPATSLSPHPDAFGFTCAAMSRSQTTCPVLTTTTTTTAITEDVSHRPRSRTLMPPAFSATHVTLSPSQRSASPTASAPLSRSPSPLPTSFAARPSPSSPRTSLRSIRQMHARKSIHSIFPPSPSALGASQATPLESAPVESTVPPTRVAFQRTRSRRASQESFHCRGPGFDAPPAADTRQPHSLGFYIRPTPAPRSVSLYAGTHSTAHPGSGARRMSDFTLSSYQQASASSSSASCELAGLGLVDSLPAAPRVVPKRLSATSQISLADSLASSAASSTSTVSLSSVEQQLTSSWPDIPTSQSWFSTCPPTPPSSIRLQLEFSSLPPASPALASSSLPHKPRPLSGLFISSNSSVLDLKETIATRMRDLGYRLSPKNLTLTLHLNDDVRSHATTALGLKLSAYGKNPAKVLDDSSRLLFEEGAQEEDLVVVDCDPSHILWSI